MVGKSTLKNKLVVEWLPWLQTNCRDSVCERLALSHAGSQPGTRLVRGLLFGVEN